MTCVSSGRCHGWATVGCEGCGVVAPCTRKDCRSCGKHPEILQEATERRTRKVAWVAKGEDIRLPVLPALPAAR